LAREQGIDLSKITGSGPGGRIVEKDVLDYTPSAAPAAPAPSAAPAPAATGERVELSRMRQAIARVTSDSKREAPHFYVTAEIDMTRAMSLRRDINDAIPAESRVSVNDLIIKAAAIALRQYPKFNASFQGEYLQMNASMNIGIAIALEAGLIVPGINNCESKSLLEIAAASKDLGNRARSGHLRNDEYSGTTFSISNLGMFDVDSFSAIIFPPHAAVLAVGTVKEQPVVRNGEITVAQIMKATLSTDHRVADGAEAAQFLVEVKKALENPVSLLL
jgi:pyruvate dehydrogenase E2 component (dihydrolipoamide acetyltransferase)